MPRSELYVWLTTPNLRNSRNATQLANQQFKIAFCSSVGESTLEKVVNQIPWINRFCLFRDYIVKHTLTIPLKYSQIADNHTQLPSYPYLLPLKQNASILCLENIKKSILGRSHSILVKCIPTGFSYAALLDLSWLCLFLWKIIRYSPPPP